MANRADFIKALKAYAYQRDRQEHDAKVATLWKALTLEQRNAAQLEDYRVRIYAAGWTAGLTVRNGEQL